jgi:LAO/AO transport system kinase
VASRAQGIEEIVAAIGKHRAWLVDSGELTGRRERRAAAEVEAIALGRLREKIGDLRDGTALPALAARVADGKIDPYAAADELLRGLGN